MQLCFHKCDSNLETMRRMHQIFENTHYRWNTTFHIMITDHFLIHINRLEPRLTEETKRHAIIDSLAQKRFNLETVVFLNYPGYLSFNYGANWWLSGLIWHLFHTGYDIIKTPECIICVDENPRKSTRALSLTICGL